MSGIKHSYGFRESFYHKKITALTSTVSKSCHCTMIIWKGDEIKCRSPNFVILRKNNILRLNYCRRAKWSWTIPRHIPYRLRYGKIKWGPQNKVLSKKISSLKSMTKLEDLTESVEGRHLYVRHSLVMGSYRRYKTYWN
jgi:hypothetical protein